MILGATPSCSATAFSSTFSSSTTAPVLARAARERSGTGTVFGIAGEAALDRRQDVRAPVRERSKPFGIERSRPSASTLRGAETATSIERVVLEDAPARHVAALRLALAPGGDLHQDGDLARLAQAAATAAARRSPDRPGRSRAR